MKKAAVNVTPAVTLNAELGLENGQGTNQVPCFCYRVVIVCNLLISTSNKMVFTLLA